MVDLEPAVKRALRYKSFDDGVSMSYLVNVFCAEGLGLKITIPQRKPGPKPKGKRPPKGS
jgi:hypothetical protein